MMRVHHLNCISTCPLGGRLMDGRTKSLVKRGHLACHCLLLETSDGLVLIDTGLGLNDVRNPKGRLSKFFLTLVSPDFREEMTAVRQIEGMGFDPRDVRHIIISHLDFDHAGGIDDFPQATVHLLKRELDYAVAQQTWLDRQRFRPQQWSTMDSWNSHEVSGGDWFGFEGAFTPAGLPIETMIIPLIGHTHGHTGVAVKRDDGTWLLYASDAYFYHEEMNVDRPRCTPGLRFYQRMMEKDRRMRLYNQERLRELARTRGGEVDIFCAHDVTEFERLAGRSPSVPASSVRARHSAAY